MLYVGSRKAGKWTTAMRYLRSAWIRGKETEHRTDDYEYLCASCRKRQPALGHSTCHVCVDWFQLPNDIHA